MSNSSAAVPAPSTAPAPSPPPSSPSSPPPSSSPAPSSPPPSSTPAPSPPAPPAPPPASPPPASSSPTLPTPPPPSIPPPQTPSSTLSPPPPSQPSPPAIKASPPPPRKATTSSPTAHSPLSPSSSSQISGVALFGIALAGVVAVTVIIALLICLMRKGKRRKPYPSEQYYPPPGNLKYQYPFERKQQWDPSSTSSSDVQVQIPLPPPPPPFPVSDIGTTPPKAGSSYREPQSLGGSRSSFTYEELAVATDNFAASNILGVGGFGYVYKGTLPGGQLVAVKQLKADGCQGEREFKAEVDIIGRIHHRHLVSLVGYCIAGIQRLLVYDFVPNRTLEYHLHGKGIPVMDWSKRMKIAVGASRGLAYLHEDCHPRIIHRDIKSSNILLDNNFEAQVSDFGLAKLTSDVNTHVTTRVMGTFGYLAPEYASSGKLTEKSDVFSFGVVLLELLTGRKPVDSSPLGDESLVEWARPLLTQILEGADLGLLIDPRLEGRYDKQEAMGMVEAAALCVRHSSHRRPRMGQVVRLLEDVDLSDVNQGVRPGHSTIYSSSYTSTDYDSSQYGADIKRFQQTALGSQEYGSEYSGTTSEYGVNPSASSSEFQNSKEMKDGTVERHSVKKKGTLTTASVSSSTEYSTSKEMENRRIYLS